MKSRRMDMVTISRLCNPQDYYDYDYDDEYNYDYDYNDDKLDDSDREGSFTGDELAKKVMLLEKRVRMCPGISPLVKPSHQKRFKSVEAKNKQRHIRTITL